MGVSRDKGEEREMMGYFDANIAISKSIRGIREKLNEIGYEIERALTQAYENGYKDAEVSELIGLINEAAKEMKGERQDETAGDHAEGDAGGLSDP